MEFIGTSKGALSYEDVKRIMAHLEDYKFWIQNFKPEPEKSERTKVIQLDIDKIKSLF